MALSASILLASVFVRTAMVEVDGGNMWGKLASYPRNNNGRCTTQHCLLNLLGLLLCLGLKGHAPRGILPWLRFAAFL